jgi:RecT family
MSELVPTTRRERTWPALQTHALELANAIAGTDFVPQGLRGNPAAITAAILYGDEVGLGPMMSLSRIAVINGKPTLSAEAQRALILNAGHDLWIEELTITRATVAGRRKNSEATSRVTWTMDDARRANLAGKQPWRQYPRQMLLARASAELARAVFPDAVGGLMAAEELEDNPELAQTDNGPQPPAPTRRRRANVQSAQQPAPVTAPPPAPAPPTKPPPKPPRPPQFMIPETARKPELPADEQAFLEAATDQFDATPEQPPPISENQRRKIHALFHDKNITDRDERLLYCSNVVDRLIESSNDLTLDEASQIIDRLEQHD